MVLVRIGWWSLAAWIYRRLLAATPDDLDLQLVLANCEVLRGRHDEALRLVGAFQNDAAVTVRVVVATHEGRFDDAIALLDAYLLRADPAAPEYDEMAALRLTCVEAQREAAGKDG